MKMRKEDLREFLIKKNLNEILDEKKVGIIMINSKKINHNNDEFEIFPIIIERNGDDMYIIYNCFFKKEMIIYNKMKSANILDKNDLHFSITKDLKVLDFETNLKKRFLNKKIKYIK